MEKNQSFDKNVLFLIEVISQLLTKWIGYFYLDFFFIFVFGNNKFSELKRPGV